MVVGAFVCVRKFIYPGGSAMNFWFVMFEIISNPFSPVGVLVYIRSALSTSDDFASFLACIRSMFFYLYFYQMRSCLSGLSLPALLLL